MRSNPISSWDGRAERQGMEKADTDTSFHLFCPSKLHSALWRQFSGFGSNKQTHTQTRTHTSCTGNLCPFAELMSSSMEPSPQCQHRGLPCDFRWSLMAILSLALSLFCPLLQHFSSVHPPILFPKAGAEPVRALNTLGIAGGDPTQLINSERVIAGKCKR